MKLTRLFVYPLLVMIFFFTASSVILAAPPVSQPVAAAQSVYKILMVNKETGEPVGSGTGFVAESKEGHLRIVTNSHVCADDGTTMDPEIGFLTKNKLVDGRELKRYIFDPYADICVLGFAEGEDKGEIPLHMSESPTKQGDPIMVVGHPKGGPLKVVIGYRINQALLPMGLIDIEVAQLMGESSSCMPVPFAANQCLYFRTSDTYRVEIFPGNSGSPVLNAEGNVVGIIWGTYMIEQNMSLAANYDQLKRYIK